MLERLIEKRTFWTSEKIVEANKNFLQENTGRYFTWEWTDTGVFFIMQDFIEFTNITTNECFSLKTIDSFQSSNEWNLYRKAYIAGANNNLSTLEMAITREVTQINNKTYEYSFTFIPGGPISNKFQLLNLEDYFVEVIDDVTNYLQCIKQAVEGTDQKLLPHILILDRIKTASGYVWKRPRTSWTLSINAVIENLCKQFELYVQHAASLNMLEQDRAQALLAESKTKWNQLL